LGKYGLLKPTGNVASKQSIIGGVLGVNVILARNKALKNLKIILVK